MRKNNHSLGLRGHFAIPPDLQNVASSHGLRIENKGGNTYRLATERDTLGNLLPGFAQDRRTYDAKSLCHVLEFLHQPIGTAMKQHAPVATAHEQRVLAHRILRFMAAGSVLIPGDAANGPQHTFLEDDEHVEIENDIRAQDLWRSATEIGGNASLPGAIPNSSVDHQRGLFVLKISDLDQATPAQEELQALLVQCLQKAQINPATSEQPQTIALTGIELERLCGAIHESSAALKPVIDRAEFDEQLVIATANIEARIKKTSFEAAAKKTTPFNDLLLVTSSLTPILKSDALRDAWTHYKFTARNNSPLTALMKEAELLQATLNRHAAEGKTGEAYTSAIAAEFPMLLGFSRQFFEAMEKASAKSGLKLGDDFSRASAISTGDLFPKKLGYLPYNDMVSSLRKSLGLVGRTTQVLQAGYGATKGFVSDMYNMARESPALCVAALGLAGYLYWTTGNNGTAEMRKYVNQIPDQSIILPPLSPGDSEVVPFDLKSLPSAERYRQNYHFDPNPIRWGLGMLKGDFNNPVGFYKHYLFDTWVTVPANKVVDGVKETAEFLHTHMGIPYDKNNHFIAAADKTIQPITDKFFYLNILQNLTHAFFWGYMLKKGWKYGPQGGMMLLKCMAPMGDLACAAGADIKKAGARLLAESLIDAKTRQATPLPERLLELGEPAGPVEKPPISLRKTWMLAAGSACAGMALVCTGLDMTGHHHAISDAVSSFNGYVGWGGMTSSLCAAYNFVDDVLGNHVIGGSVSLLMSAGLAAAYRKAVLPAGRAIVEKARPQTATLPRNSPKTLENA